MAEVHDTSYHHLKASTSVFGQASPGLCPSVQELAHGDCSWTVFFRYLLFTSLILFGHIAILEAVIQCHGKYQHNKTVEQRGSNKLG